MIYDTIIIGAGPAGLTAAIYLKRANKNVLVLEKETFGGQITHSPKVENYPGFISVSGVEFADKLEYATLSTIEDGKMTKDLALITSLENPIVLNSEDFIKAIAEKLA